MTSKLAEQKQELNTTLLKNIEKDNSIGRLSEQLESKPSVPTPSDEDIFLHYYLLVKTQHK
jgi:hypothetical protein